METTKYFIFRIRRFDGLGYKYGIYNKDEEKWGSNIVFRGSLEECENKILSYE